MASQDKERDNEKAAAALEATSDSVHSASPSAADELLEKRLVAKVLERHWVGSIQ